MNYKIETLKCKIFNFSKQLLRNLILAGCVAIIAALLVVHFSNFAIYVVLSDSMQPYIKKGDCLFIKEQTEYTVGDVVSFEDGVTGLNITHRIIGIKQIEGSQIYICCGDNESLLFLGEEFKSVELKIAIVERLNISDFKDLNVQMVKHEDVQGKVVDRSRVLGWIIFFAQNNWGLISFGLIVLILNKKLL